MTVCSMAHMNYWQAAIEDVDRAAWIRARAAKHLIFPPGYDKGKVPAGYIAMPSDIYQGYAPLRLC